MRVQKCSQLFGGVAGDSREGATLATRQTLANREELTSPHLAVDTRVGNAGSSARVPALRRAQTPRPPRLPATGARAANGNTGAARATASVGARTDAELRKACEELESVFLEQLLKEMRRTVPKDDLFSGGRGEDVFQSMFDQEIAKKMAGRGGIGLAEILVRQLSRQAVPPSRLGGHRLGNPTGENGLAED